MKNTLVVVNPQWFIGIFLISETCWLIVMLVITNKKVLAMKKVMTNKGQHYTAHILIAQMFNSWIYCVYIGCKQHCKKTLVHIRCYTIYLHWWQSSEAQCTMLSCVSNSKNLRPDVNVPTARMPSFPFLINSSCPSLMCGSWVIPKQEQQQVSNNGRLAIWVGVVFTRCAALVTNMEHDNPSLKIPHSV